MHSMSWFKLDEAALVDCLKREINLSVEIKKCYFYQSIIMAICLLGVVNVFQSFHKHCEIHILAVNNFLHFGKFNPVGLFGTPCITKHYHFKVVGQKAFDSFKSLPTKH